MQVAAILPDLIQCLLTIYAQIIYGKAKVRIHWKLSPTNRILLGQHKSVFELVRVKLETSRQT